MTLSASLPIGLFDSGVGGLTVFKAVRDLLPRETLVYLGDTARVPYGVKSKDTIVKYTLGAAEKLREQNIKALIIACNTATSAALPTLREYLGSIPVIGVIDPGAEAAVRVSENKKIAVIGTEATIRAKAYQKAIARISPGTRVVSRACTLFVPLAEEGWLSGEATEKICEKYLGDIFADADAPDTLLLGCTHFPLLIPALRKVVGEKVKIVDSSKATALRARDALEAAN
ncbi:MAG: glutamate racemase, partial [Desulfovibrio sp.]|nr:glutamate racemase [Desulfovibrio sp.]